MTWRVNNKDSDEPHGDSHLDSDLAFGDSDLDRDLQVGDSDSQVGDSNLDSDLPVGDSTTTLAGMHIPVPDNVLSYRYFQTQQAFKHSKLSFDGICQLICPLLSDGNAYSI